MMMLLVAIVIDFFSQPYKNILRRSFVSEIKYVFLYAVYNYLALITVLYLFKFSAVYSRTVIIITYLLFTVMILLIRTLWKQMIIKKSKNSLISSNNKLVVISSVNDIDDALDHINNYNFDMYEIVGLCFIDDNKEGEEYKGYKVIANIDNVLSYICINWVDEVFIATALNDVPKYIYDGLAAAGITTSIRINRMEEFEGQDQKVKKLFNTNVLTTSVKQRTVPQMLIKKTMDIIGGIVGTLITFVLTIFIAPLIYIKSPGPIFYKQERIGKNGRKFYMYKFRSMVTNADDLKQDLMEQNIIKDGMMFKVKDDPRIIPGIGEFIRKTSLDEFPQFFNVLKGDMSLVGTRPPTTDEWVKYKLEHRIRMAIKPGITGLWQTSGRSKITDFDKVIEYDTKYINNWSIGLDIEILFKTVVILLFSKREDEAM